MAKGARWANAWAARARGADDVAPRPEGATAREPDPEFFRGLVEQYQGLVFKYVYQIVRDYHLTQDLSQEVFLKVYRRFHTYDARHLLSTWLLKVAHNHAVDHLRKRRVATVSMERGVGEGGQPLVDSLPQAQPDALRLVERRDQRSIIRNTIYSMPPDQRGVLVLRYLEGRKLEEIAYILGLPLGTVKSRINRARQVLQARLREAL